ncbi:hypothetical protein K458DRAFT_417131 [Lentithecium fluviatile CBS 122367]|uniref:Uncharacterized protein n=1 Tax=Lentithecium fluviatile CBS 122367 TaxID=1168545 RepID=A0A6G1J6Y6_9PLEO|nr:hypothetical protein K458DRAFT_417131 [Lentithecium fluviatile CBS 122367]
MSNEAPPTPHVGTSPPPSPPLQPQPEPELPKQPEPPKKLTGDPKSWTSKSPDLTNTSLWSKDPSTLYSTLRVAFGIDQAKPLLVSTIEEGTYFLSANLQKRNASGTAATHVSVPSFFLFSATAGAVRQVVKPATLPEILVALDSSPASLEVVDVVPLNVIVKGNDSDGAAGE